MAGPESKNLRLEAQARKRAADALEDAETAEKIKLELDAYIAVRARRLEIERRRVELASTLEVVERLHDELNESEKLRDVQTTQLNPETVQILDDITKAKRPTFPAFYLYGIPVGRIMQFAYEQISSRAEKNRLSRLSSLAPEALSERDTPSAGQEVRSE
jgi:predicted RNase H-like nuclease (RuvC/YqgF family)